MRNSGWKRLWLVTTTALLVVFAFFSLADHNVRQATGSSWYCVPGTKTEEVIEQYAGKFEPPDWMIEKKAAEIRTTNGKDNGIIDEMVAKSFLERDLTQTVTVFTCTSYSNIFWAALMAMLTSLAIAGVFGVTRWVVDGFQKTANAKED